MWIRFDLGGMIVHFKISGYTNKKTDDWVKVSYKFDFQNVINYAADDCEILMNDEVITLRDEMQDLLDDKITEPDEWRCLEPDFSFVFSPKYDVRKNPNLLYVKPGHEIIDISMELKVNLWGTDGLSANYFSMTFDREEIEMFHTYLSLITKEIDLNDEKANDLINQGKIYGNIQ